MAVAKGPGRLTSLFVENSRSGEGADAPDSESDHDGQYQDGRRPIPEVGVLVPVRGVVADWGPKHEAPSHEAIAPIVPVRVDAVPSTTREGGYLMSAPSNLAHVAHDSERT